MIVLHVSLLGNQLALWGEAPVQTGSPRASAGKKRVRTVPPLHPYAANARDLLALETQTIGFKPAKRRTRAATAWLPSAGRLPFPSSAILGEIPSRGKPAILPWAIGVYPLDWREAAGLVTLSGEKKVLSQGMIAGDEMQFWSRVLRFAASLTTRQQFLPGIRTMDELSRAVWEPVLTGQDALHATSLAESMPPIAVALSDVPAAKTSPQVERRRTLIAALTGFVDHFVRSAAAVDPVNRLTRRGHRSQAAGDATVHDRWVRALQSADNRISGNTNELRQLEEGLAGWRRSVDVNQNSRSRLCFRLSDPQEAPGKDWNLDYLVQSLDDRSVLLPVGRVWKSRASDRIIARHLGSGTKEYVLSSLAHASALSPPIGKSLKRSVPSSCALTTSEAHEFLRETAPALEQAGFGVMLPAWWSRKGTKLRLAARGKASSPAMAGESVFSFDALVDFHWELALGDKTLTKEELDALANLKTPLVRLRGQWVEVNSEEIRKAVERLSASPGERKTAGEIVHMELAHTGGFMGLAVEGISATGWIGDLLKKLRDHETFEELPPPEGFAGTLRPYQLRGFSWLTFPRQWGFGVCLADDMGLGKTIQVLALIQRDREAGMKTPVLVVCPTSVVNNWMKEAARFTPGLPVMVHHGVGRRRGEELRREALSHAIVVSTYGLMQRDLAYLQAIPWAGVILDEAQNIKNPEAKQSRASHELKAGYRIALTGTPVENTVGDLWSIFRFLNPGLLGTRAEFKRTFFLPIQTGQDDGTADRLKRITGPFILRRLKTDKSIISDLPEKMEMKVFCSLTREQASLYKSVLKVAEDELQAAEGIGRRGVILATLTRLKQVCNHPTHFLGDNSSIPGRSGKVARLAEMLEEVIASGDRALVFTQFAEMGGILKAHLQETFGREVLFLHGGTSRRQRDELVDRFQGENGGPSLFVLSLKAGGTGLNLTGANHVFHFDRWWNPAVEQQATDRAFRIGQKKNVQVHKFICSGTLEEKIDEMIERKKGIAERVVGAGEGWLTELTNDELRDILTLRTESVADQ